MTHLLSKLLAVAAISSAIGWTAVAQAQTASAGEKKAQQCIGCHGIPGYQASFPEVHRVPKISGQNEKYIASALHEYRSGERRHPTMRGIATSLTDADIADLAAFYHAQPQDKVEVPAKPEKTPSEHVAELLSKSNCVSCHGANFNTPIDPSYPKIAGQFPDYLYVALKAYQTRGNPDVGRTHAIMSAMAQPYTHEQLRDIADYLGTLPGELHTIPQSRFR